MWQRKQVVISVAAIVVIAIVAAAAILWFQGAREPALTAERARELLHLRNVGLGELENQKIDAGIAAFDQLARELPREAIGRRNLAVARVVALGEEQVVADANAIAAANDALARLRELEGESEEYHWLAFRVAWAEEDHARSATHLDAILQNDARNAAAWYARYRLLKDAPQPPAGPTAVESLTRAVAAGPQNAWLLVEWLREVGFELGQLDAGDPFAIADFPQRLEEARPVVQAFAHIIRTHHRIEPLELLDNAAAAAKEKDWPEAAHNLRMLANVLLPHSVRDRQEVLSHPLEFVLNRFSPALYERFPDLEPQPPSIEVAFRVNPSWDLPEHLAASLGPIRAAAVADFNVDGAKELIVLGDNLLAVLTRGDNGWTSLAQLEVQGYEHLIAVDLDADFDETVLAVHGDGPDGARVPPSKTGCPSADVDFILYGSAGIQLVENLFQPDDRTRTLVARELAGLEAADQPITAVATGDIDGDGDIDLVVCTAAGLAIWSNNGNWSFTDLTDRSSLEGAPRSASRLLAADLDRDVDIDVLVAAGENSGWLENVRHGQLRWRSFSEQFPELSPASDVEILEADGNASWDLLSASARGVQICLTTAPSAGVIRKQECRQVSESPGARMLLLDYDNDGYDDLFTWSDQGAQLLRGLPDARFEPVDLFDPPLPTIEFAEAGDIDGDGDLDLLIVSQGKLSLYENVEGNKNHWIEVALQAQQIKGEQHAASGRVSPYGLGSLLELKMGGRYQAKVVRGQSTHFGIGDFERADVIRVLWLNGVPQNIVQPPANLFVCEQQILTTSCPYLYGWDGEKFVFITDLLWAAPLGLQFAEGVLAPARDWEYLKLPGEKMVPRDGRYVLQLTEELWEAAYFDEVRLIAVDHPADVEVYSNEKVGPAVLAQFKIHAARERRRPAAVVNHRGRSLLDDVAADDGIYAKAFDHKFRQGVVEEHFLEIDLGELEDPQRITLFLTGWVYPPSTSINVALSQGDFLAPPSPPSLEVADGNGGWVAAMPYMGFPGGKTKTIAIDLSGLFQADDYRLRIRTSMELFWDHIFFTVDEEPAEIKTQEVKLLRADLHDRGYSRVVPDPGNGPEQFLYNELSTRQKWPTMFGTFTRFGDVKPLLDASDDRLLVMGAGDEATLEFEALPDPPPGWKRDFLFYSVGWDKDCNLLTVAGEDSGPLPFRSMSSYPWPGDESLPNSPEYREYERTYQTRRQGSSFWKEIRNATPERR
jgi:hypothetical protein